MTRSQLTGLRIACVSLLLAGCQVNVITALDSSRAGSWIIVALAGLGCGSVLAVVVLALVLYLRRRRSEPCPKRGQRLTVVGRPGAEVSMRRIPMLVLLVMTGLGCGLLPTAGDVGSLFPTFEVPTPEYPEIGTLDTGALGLQATIVGTVVDQYGSAMPGAVVCFGAGEADAVAIGVTDSAGAYSAALPESFRERSDNLVWMYLPLYRFEPDRVQVSAMMMGEEALDFVAYPSVYPVPPERDCR